MMIDILTSSFSSDYRIIMSHNLALSVVMMSDLDFLFVFFFSVLSRFFNREAPRIQTLGTNNRLDTTGVGIVVVLTRGGDP